MEKKTTTPSSFTPEEWEHFQETQRLLAERIAYHEAKIAEEKAAREGQNAGDR